MILFINTLTRGVKGHIKEKYIHLSRQEAIRTVNNFIDELEALEVSNEMINDFIKNSKCVG